MNYNLRQKLNVESVHAERQKPVDLESSWAWTSGACDVITFKTTNTLFTGQVYKNFRQMSQLKRMRTWSNQQNMQL